jgi:DNA-binding MarR family transcriptional regulator
MSSRPGALPIDDAEHALRPPSCLADRIGFLLARSHLDAHAIAEAVIGDGLQPKHFGCMSVIVEEGPLSQQELGERMRVDRTTIVAVVDELERRGFLARRRNPADRRAYALEATPAGRRWRERTEVKLVEAEARILEPLDDDERERLIELLRKLVFGRRPAA